MSFSDWQGNEHLIARLKQMIRSGRIFHGCLFEGSPQQTERLADDFVRRRSAKGRTATPAAYVLSAENSTPETVKTSSPSARKAV